MRNPMYRFILPSVLACGVGLARAESGDVQKMLDKSFTSSKGAVKYLLFVPKNYDATKKYPLVVSLRGAGSTYTSATDGFDMAHPWIEDSIQTRVPHFVMVPECISGSWGGMVVGGGAGPSAMEAPSVAVIEAIEALKGQYSLDTNRFIIQGFSIGGAGTYHMITFKTDYWAAAIPCAAGGDSTRIESIAKTPIWHHQGMNDGNGGAGIRMQTALENHKYKTVKVTVDYTIASTSAWKSAVQGSNPYDVIFKNAKAPVTLDSLKRAIAGGADYIYTFMTGGSHEAGFMGAAHNPLLATWAFSKVRGGGSVSLAPAPGRSLKRNGAVLSIGVLPDAAGAAFNVQGRAVRAGAGAASAVQALLYPSARTP